MKKHLLLPLAVIPLLLLAACGSQPAAKDDLTAQYPYQAEIDGNKDVLILAKSEEALNKFVEEKAISSIDAALSGLEEVDIVQDSSGLSVEKAEFENANEKNPFSHVYITVRNNTGKPGTLVNLYVDFTDENGDILNTTYPQYSGVLEDGQAIRMDAMYEGIPYGVRVSAANMENIDGGERIDVKLDPPFTAENPNP